MAEMLDIYDLDGRFLGVQDRSDYYSESIKEFQDKGEITRQVRSVRILLMGSNGRIYLQKRSYKKDLNPGMFDKTIGGHVEANTSFNLTVVKECAEELGIPSAVLTDEEYLNSAKSINLRTVAVLRHLKTVNRYLSHRKISHSKEYYDQPYLTAFYVGYFDGPIQFTDGEAVGIMTFSLDELHEHIKQRPEDFTEDISYILNNFRDEIKPLK